MSKVKKISKLVGLNVKIARFKAGLSQEELAEKSHLGLGTIGTVERGNKTPTIETIAAIASGLGIEMYKLFIFEE